MSLNEPIERRLFLKAASLVGAALAVEGVSGASKHLGAAMRISRPDPNDPPPIPNDTVRKLMADRFQDRTISRGHVTLDMPAMAEDGRFVPVIVESDLPMGQDQFVKAIYLIVDHNPDPLVTAFHLTPAIGPIQIQTRIKLKRSTWIRAIAESNTGELWADYLQVETTLNGCG